MPIEKFEILCLIPMALLMLWAFIVKMRAKLWIDAFTLLIAGLAVLLNFGIMYQALCHYDVPLWGSLMQLIVSPMIVPLVYMYFARQFGREFNNGTTAWCWGLMALLLVPSVSIVLDPWNMVEQPDAMKMCYVHFFYSGKCLYAISVPSVIIVIQAILTMVRIPVITKTMSQYELHFSAGVRSFLTWWVAAILFVLYTSLVPMELLQQPAYSWSYFIIMGVLGTAIYLHIALQLDLHPIRTEEDTAVEVSSFIQENRDLAHRARRLMMEERLYLHLGITIDEVANMLGTNRTYFTRMMRAEFGLSFNEYVSSERIRYSQTLLSSSDSTLDEIAENCGFTDASSFCRVFKRITGTTPDSWRRSVKGEES